MIEVGKVMQFIPFIGLMAGGNATNNAKSARVLEILIIVVVMGYTSLKIAESKIESIDKGQNEANRVLEQRIDRIEQKLDWIIREQIARSNDAVFRYGGKRYFSGFIVVRGAS